MVHHKDSWSEYLTTAVHALTDPIRDIEDDDRLRLSRLMASIMLGTIALVILLFAVRAPSHVSTPFETVMRIALVGALMLAYLLVRAARYWVANAIVVASSTACLFVLALFDTTGFRLQPLNYLVIVILYSSLFLPKRITLAIFAGQIAGLAALPFLISDVTLAQMINGPISMNLTLGLFVMIIAHYRDDLEAERKEQIAKSESFLSSILDGIQDGISILDTDLNILYANRWMEKLYADEMPLDDSKCYQAYQRRSSVCDWCPATHTLRTKQPHTSLVPYPSSDDPTGWIELTTLPMLDEDGNVDSIIEYVRDVTEQKRVESELRKLSSVVEQSPTSVVITDTNGTIEYVNPKFTTLTGYTREEAQGNNPSILKTEHTDPSVHRDLWKTISAGQEWRGEFVNKKKNGELYWELASIAPIKDEQGNTTHYVAVKEDITERKMLQEEIDRHHAHLETLVEERTAEVQDSQHRYRALFEGASDAVFIMSLEGAHLSANARACEMLGYQPEEMLGLTFREIVAPEEVSKSEAVLPRLLAGEYIPIYERRFRRKNGDEFPVEINVQLVKDRAGNPLHIQSIVRDISQRKEAEQALQLAYQQLQSLDRLKDQLIDSVSHELRTPITNLKLYHHLVASNPEEMDRYLNTLTSQTNRLEEIVEGILFAQKVQEDLIKYNPVKFNMKDLVASSVAVFRQKTISGPEGIDLRWQADTSHLHGDPVLIKRAFDMILDNALKFSVDTGSVTVIVRDTLIQNQPGLSIEVENLAKDLAADDVNYLFDRFYRGANALSMGISGAGLGLPIARQIVEQHGGHVSVEGHPGEVTIFRVAVQLPVRQAAPTMSSD